MPISEGLLPYQEIYRILQVQIQARTRALLNTRWNDGRWMARVNSENSCNFRLWNTARRSETSAAHDSAALVVLANINILRITPSKRSRAEREHRSPRPARESPFIPPKLLGGAIFTRMCGITCVCRYYLPEVKKSRKFRSTYFGNWRHLFMRSAFEIQPVGLLECIKNVTNINNSISGRQHVEILIIIGMGDKERMSDSLGKTRQS